MNFCDQVAQAILTCEDVQAALATVIATVPAVRDSIVDMLQENEEFNQWLKTQVYRITAGQITGKLVPGDCDNSVVAGRAIALVNRLDVNNKDFLEMVETGTNDEERIADILEAIPVLNEAPVGDALSISQDFLEDFAENYNSISTEERKLEMAEDIYCIMLEDPECTITFERLFEYFQTKATSGLNILSTVFDVIGFLSDGDFDNDDQIWFGMFALQVGFVLNSRDFFGVGIGTIGGIMRDADPSSAWEDWDECGPPVEPTFTLTDVLSPGQWLDGVPNTYEFIGKTVEGYDIFDLNVKQSINTPPDVQSAWTIDPPAAHIYAVITDLTDVNYYYPSPTWPTSDSTNGIYMVKPGTTGGTIRVHMGPPL